VTLTPKTRHRIPITEEKICRNRAGYLRRADGLLIRLNPTRMAARNISCGFTMLNGQIQYVCEECAATLGWVW